VVLDGVVCWAPRLGIVHFQTLLRYCTYNFRNGRRCRPTAVWFRWIIDVCGANERFPAAVPETDDEL
jgi:hypothetical protein